MEELMNVWIKPDKNIFTWKVIKLSFFKIKTRYFVFEFIKILSKL